MYTRIVLFVALVSCLPVSASANLITYAVSVNTSSISGTTGSLDFNFNPGPLVTQAASVQIVGFSGTGSPVGSPTLTGDIGGALPGTLTFDNGTAFNDYFQGFKFGSALSFSLSLSGPALSSPDGSSTSGSAFAFSMFSNAAGTIPALTSNTAEGFAFIVNVNLDGTTTLVDYSTQTSVVAPNSGAPEPNSFVLVGSGMTLAFGVLSFFRRARFGVLK